MTLQAEDRPPSTAGGEHDHGVADLLGLLDVEQVGDWTFRGECRNGAWGRVFGGQVVAQALAAGVKAGAPTDKVAHSLHAHFMRAGEAGTPITFQVSEDFDGRSFATRQVTAIQGEHPILSMTVSLQRPEDGLSHQDEMPAVPSPEAAKEAVEAWRRSAAAERAPRAPAVMWRGPIELVPVDVAAFFSDEPREARSACWIRVVGPVGAVADHHRMLMAYVSDMMLLRTSTLPHRVNWNQGGVRSASLDHALWLHETPRMDDWHLYATDSPWAGHARGLNFGRIFREDGRLVASVAQEGLVRTRSLAADPTRPA